MKYLNIFFVFGLAILFNSCFDCYDRLVLIQENPNNFLIKDNKIFFSNNDVDFIISECGTDCSNDVYNNDKRFIFFSVNIIPNKNLILKKDYFQLTDSLNHTHNASQLRVDQRKYDSLMLLPDNNYSIEVAYFSEDNKYFYAPYKTNFGYKLLEKDTLKYFLKDTKFIVKLWEEISEENLKKNK